MQNVPIHPSEATTGQPGRADSMLARESGPAAASSSSSHLTTSPAFPVVEAPPVTAGTPVDISKASSSASIAVDRTTKEYISQKFVGSQSIIRIQTRGNYTEAHDSIDTEDQPVYQVSGSFLNGFSAVLIGHLVKLSSSGEWVRVEDAERKIIKVKNCELFMEKEDCRLSRVLLLTTSRSPSSSDLTKVNASEAHSEYQSTKKVYDTVLRRRKVEASLLPSQVGRIQEWCLEGWKDCDYWGMITPLHIPLLTFVEDNATNPDLVILVMVKAALALESIHSCSIKHLDLKPRNIIVVKTAGEQAGEVIYSPRYIDLEQTQFGEANPSAPVAGGTFGYNSLMVVALHIYITFKKREEAFRDKRGDSSRTRILEAFNYVAQQGQTNADDRFALGSSFFEALMICQNALLKRNRPTQLLDASRQERIMAEIRQEGRIMAWSVVRLKLETIASQYRGVWDRKEYRARLAEDFVGGFEKCFKVLDFMLQPTYYNELLSATSSIVERASVYEDLRDTVLSQLARSGASGSKYPTKTLNLSETAILKPRMSDGRFTQRLQFLPPPSQSGPSTPSTILEDERSFYPSDNPRDPSSGKSVTARESTTKKPYERLSAGVSSSSSPSSNPQHVFQGNSSWSYQDGTEITETPEGNKWVSQEAGKEAIFEIWITNRENDPSKAYSRPWRHGRTSKRSRYVCNIHGCKDITQEAYFACNSMGVMLNHWKNKCRGTSGIVPDYEAIPVPAETLT